MTLTAAAPPAADVVERLDPRSPRARVQALLDDSSFQPYDCEDDSGVLSGSGRVDGSRVVVFATDPRVQGGALGTAGCARIAAATDSAVREGVPVVGIWASGGARLQEGVASLDGVGRVFAAMVAASGRVPQLSLVLGPAAGGAAYGPALTDIVVMGPSGRVFVTGPDVVRSVTGEDVSAAQLGGGETHGSKSGVVHVVADSDEEALRSTRRLAGLLAAQVRLHEAAGLPLDEQLAEALPASPRRAYDVHKLLRRLLDGPTSGGSPDDGPVELQAKWARNMVTQLGRIGGRTVGVVANNPLHLGGCLDSASAEKAAKFVRMCDSFGVPLVVVVDVPGYLPGVKQEFDGVVRRGAKLLHAFADAVVPRVTLVTRKAYGGAYIAMNSRSLGATAVYAWPTAELAVMGSTAAVGILHRRTLAATPEHEMAQVTAELAAEHERSCGGLAKAVELGVVDGVIEPASTRRVIGQAIADAPVRRGGNRNIPL